MSWPKGKPRPKNSGRKPGTPNKSSLGVAEICAQHGGSPLEVLIDLMKDEDKNIRLRAAMEVSQYIYAKRKALEISADVDLNLAKQAKEYSELPKEEQIKLMEAEIKRLKSE